MSATYDLERFVTAQTPVYDAVLGQLAGGQLAGGPATRDWVGCIFPQLEGLEFSDASGFYTLRDRIEAAAYLAHPILGLRLIECTKLAIRHAVGGGRSLFEHGEDQGFHASITLFSRVKDASPVFESALFAFYGGSADPRTLKALRLAFVATLDD